MDRADAELIYQAGKEAAIVTLCLSGVRLLARRSLPGDCPHTGKDEKVLPAIQRQ